MKKIFLLLALSALASSAIGDETTSLQVFLQENGRIPKGCVSKNNSYKCNSSKSKHGGQIFNLDTKRSYVYDLTEEGESYLEMKCESFDVVNDNGKERITCSEETLMYEAHYNTQNNTINISEYDELGILKDKNSYKSPNQNFCRKKFHCHYGSIANCAKFAPGKRR